MSTLFSSLRSIVKKSLAREEPVQASPDIANRERAELKRLARLPRSSATTTVLRGTKWTLIDAPSFSHQFKSYFVNEEYRFECENSAPRIIDCGANVGVSVRYWKSLYPGARIIAIEPDASALTALKSNVSGLADVQVIGKAAWIHDNEIEFAAAGNDGGHLASLTERERPVPLVRVGAVRLQSLLSEKVEMLKLDIEGAELEVLRDCADELSFVERMFVEFHSFVRQPQVLSELTGIIERAGFRVYGKVEYPAAQPFLHRPVYNEKDFRLNLWCYRGNR